MKEEQWQRVRGGVSGKLPLHRQLQKAGGQEGRAQCVTAQTAHWEFSEDPRRTVPVSFSQVKSE